MLGWRMRQLVHRLNVSTLVTSLSIGRVQARSLLLLVLLISRLTFGSCQAVQAVLALVQAQGQGRVAAVLVALRRSPLKPLGMLNTQSPSVLVVVAAQAGHRTMGPMGQ